LDSPNFDLIPCRVCSATTVILTGRRRPRMCARCRAPYDAGEAAFVRGETPPPLEPARPAQPKARN